MTQSTSSWMQAGCSQRDITPNKPLNLCGQLHIRTATHARDPLTVNALVLQSGEQRVAIVSLDIIAIPDTLRNAVYAALPEFAGPIWLAATHTHLAPFPCTVFWRPEEGEVDQEWFQYLVQQTVAAIREASANLHEVALYCNTTHLEGLAYQRMAVTPDGHTAMYYGYWNPDFSRLCGPRDGEVSLLYGKRVSDGNISFVLSSFACHPNSMESESFYSADFPGEVRRSLQSVLGQETGIIYLTGAAGDIAPQLMEAPSPDPIVPTRGGLSQPWRNHEGAVRAGRYLGGAILHAIHELKAPMQQPELAWKCGEIPLVMREPGPEDPVQLTGGALQQLYRDFADKKAFWRDILQHYQGRINVLRVGDFALCTNTAELYVEYGLQIKQSSPAKVTAISELTDGYMGYVPTPEITRTGGYSGWFTFNSIHREDTGNQIVQLTKQFLQELF
jgi:neutral ceramidase